MSATSSNQEPRTKNQEHSSSTNEVLVRVENVSKKFCRDLKKSLWYGVKDVALELNPFAPTSNSDRESGAVRQAQPSLRDGEFWAVNNVSFELRRGECIGLIGRNGAGKTTLLKMLNGLIKPDSGTIEMRGRVGALIALGAGFNPILTGRENIYVNGTILGLTKAEIDAKIDDIIDFAELAEFIDAPVQSYSSGMSVRLGFSIASSLSPDILILDEVLAVGDIGFVIKCLNRVRQLSSTSAVIFVSHTMQFVSSFCTRVIVMENGSPKLDAPNSHEGINCYFGLMKAEGSTSGTGGARLLAFSLKSAQKPCGSEPTVQRGANLSVALEIEIDLHISDSRPSLYIDDESRSQIIGYPLLDLAGASLTLQPGRNLVEADLGEIDLNAGTYSFLVIVGNRRTNQTLLRQSAVAPFKILDDSVTWAKIIRPIQAVTIPLT